MNIKEFQNKIVEEFKKVNDYKNRRKHTKQSAFVHLTEEIGEIARHITNEYHRPEKFSKEEIGSELADAMMFLVLLAKLYDVDLSKEMSKSIGRVKKKNKQRILK